MDQNELQNDPEMVHPARMTQETCWMDQKQDLGHIPQTVHHAGSAHKRAIQCEDLPMRHAPFIPKQIIPASNRQKTCSHTRKRLVPHRILMRLRNYRAAAHLYGLLSLDCIRLDAARTFNHMNTSLRNHWLKSRACRPFAKSRAHLRTGKDHPPNPRGICPQHQQSQPLGATHA